MIIIAVFFYHTSTTGGAVNAPIALLGCHSGRDMARILASLTYKILYMMRDSKNFSGIFAKMPAKMIKK